MNLSAQSSSVLPHHHTHQRLQSLGVPVKAATGPASLAADTPAAATSTTLSVSATPSVSITVSVPSQSPALPQSVFPEQWRWLRARELHMHHTPPGPCRHLWTLTTSPPCWRSSPSTSTPSSPCPTCTRPPARCALSRIAGPRRLPSLQHLHTEQAGMRSYISQSVCCACCAARHTSPRHVPGAGGAADTANAPLSLSPRAPVQMFHRRSARSRQRVILYPVPCWRW